MLKKISRIGAATAFLAAGAKAATVTYHITGSETSTIVAGGVTETGPAWSMDLTYEIPETPGTGVFGAASGVLYLGVVSSSFTGTVEFLPAGEVDDVPHLRLSAGNFSIYWVPPNVCGAAWGNSPCPQPDDYFLDPGDGSFGMIVSGGTTMIGSALRFQAVPEPAAGAVLTTAGLLLLSRRNRRTSWRLP